MQAYVWPIVFPTLWERGLRLCPDWKHFGLQSMFADLGLLLFGITMAIGAAKRVLFLCDATLSTYLGTIGCPLAKPKKLK